MKNKTKEALNELKDSCSELLNGDMLFENVIINNFHTVSFYIAVRIRNAKRLEVKDVERCNEFIDTRKALIDMAEQYKKICEKLSNETRIKLVTFIDIVNKSSISLGEKVVPNDSEVNCVQKLSKQEESEFLSLLGKFETSMQEYEESHTKLMQQMSDFEHASEKFEQKLSHTQNNI